MLTDTKDVFFERINKLYQAKKPFFFLTDYQGKQMEVTAIDELDCNISFQAPNMCFPEPQPNKEPFKMAAKELYWQTHPITYEAYKKSFDQVKEALQQGNSYLVNLTCSTPIDTNYTLSELYTLGQGKYKLLYRDQFVHFSPEPFIRIENNKISSYPMKGTITIGENESEAADKLRFSEKEIAEQYTIVDLIRNDLYQVATDVEVASFRYLEKLKTNQKNLYTVSSHITGNLRPAYLHQPGDVFKAMLPAGSITGAPKAATKKIIRQAETHNRNYYTGVWGYYNGKVLDSCVIIRYLESTPEGFIFKSGGGITSLSDPKAEFQEMISKVYVPLP